MRKNKVIMLLFFIVVIFLINTVAVCAIDYSISEIGIKFTIPDGWKEKPLSNDRGFIKVKYVPLEENGEAILFGYKDIWNELPASEKTGYTKSDFNNSIFTKSDVAKSLSTTTDKVSMVTYNEVEYYKCNVSQNVTVANQSVKVNMLAFVYIMDGIMYQFQYGENATGVGHYNDFETILNNIAYPEPLKKSASSSVNSVPATTANNKSDPMDFSAINLLLSLLITIIIYSFPICIYRYAILKKPIETRKAKIITIVYAIIAFLSISAILYAINVGTTTATGGGIFLWSFVNYKLLTGGVDNSKNQNS